MIASPIDLMDFSTNPQRPQKKEKRSKKERKAATTITLIFFVHPSLDTYKGHCSSSWQERTDQRGKARVQVKFSVLDCRDCRSRTDCTKIDRRILTVHRQEEFQALAEARRLEKTPEWKKLYQKRAGVEGTISQAVRNNGLRRARYIGIAKMRLQTILTAAAINLSRITNWLGGVLLAKTRRSTFADLMRVETAIC